MVHSTECSPERRDPPRFRRDQTDVLLEPVPRLEWSLATEAHPVVAEAAAPASLRRSWIHTAAEQKVLDLYRKLHGSASRLPAPWWLRALDRGELSSRAEGFAFEDDVHRLLTSRDGWVFVPWAGTGETGYWEYAPSERGTRHAPTTVALTDDHPGWVEVVAAHTDGPPPPLPLSGTGGLLAALPVVESW
ncbi:MULTISPECIES: hypothetical protein [unclassified Saccharopolyspora]|uniref:hypothetical protein n=1 Tax=unclassified Saccharopolyspora TaxID=2646250 RepID=UPI001CD3800D|nr:MULTISPECIES: hypothetical protein [unclassified Saccharopolyspora]MCA1188396.1 hypothetical protein [Saccharopolyspora sp. 6T]MCA1194806.1 hypothetical protein [Saccharopolyspora sp. 6V]MCA1228258.1 hypothetical protein [Saccharopolyspora sp. 6M]MCA1281292.1 hypothetical protein [Saccharopolyspora sp. 7B]